MTEPTTGPWDISAIAASSDDAGQPRISFGSLELPAIDGMEVRIDVDEQGSVTSVAVAVGETAIQLQAFAAPKSSGLWDEVRAEMIEGIKESGGKAELRNGPVGPEIAASLMAEDGKTSQLQPVRFVGADGPRWFLRGAVSGPGAHDDAEAAQVFAIWRRVVVSRGDQAFPPRELLPLQLPDDPAFAAVDPVP